MCLHQLKNGIGNGQSSTGLEYRLERTLPPNVPDTHIHADFHVCLENQLKTLPISTHHPFPPQLVLSAWIASLLSSELATWQRSLWCFRKHLVVFFFNWKIITLQYYVAFCYTTMWISCKYTYIPSLLSLPPNPPPSHSSRSSNTEHLAEILVL